MKRYVLIAMVTVAALAFAYAQAPDPVTLKQRASVSLSGQYVTLMPTGSEPTYPDLETLTHLSTDVIVGTAGANVCQLSPGGDFITTNYAVTVQEVLKGSLSPGSAITVSLPGGKVMFRVRAPSYPPVTDAISAPPDTSAEVRTPWFKKMESGKQYYLFLTGGGVLNQNYHVGNLETTGGPQGVFEVANGVVESNSGRMRDPIWRYHNMAVSTFKTAILNAVAAEPGSSCAVCP